MLGRAKIDYKHQNINVFSKNIPFYQGKGARDVLNRVNSNSIDGDCKLPFLPLEAYGFGKFHFLIDADAEVSIIKDLCLDPKEFDSNNKTKIRGIGPNGESTCGLGEINILGTSVNFHVVSRDFPIPGEGILGSDYLTESNNLIDFEHQTIKINGIIHRFFMKSTNELPQDVYSASSKFDQSVIEARIPSSLDMNLGDDLVEEPVESCEEVCPEDISELPVRHTFVCTNGLNEVLDVDEVEIASSLSSISGTHEIEPQGEIEPPSDNPTDFLRLDHLHGEEKEYVVNLVQENKEIFHLPGQHLPGTDVVMHRIPTTSDEPINTRQYKYPHALKDEISRQVKELLAAGIIEPSTSSYGSPLWCVPKKPDSQGRPKWRFVVDFRGVNSVTLPDGYPLPDITEIFDQVGGAKYYTVLDLASGFHQIKMDPKDAHKTAFSTPFGHYQFVRMPFGLRDAPGTFQRLMDDLLRGLQGFILFVYLDNICIYTDSIEEHDRKIKLLFERLRAAGLKLQTDKCEFLKRRVSYLGHVLSEQGLSVDDRKIACVKAFQRAKDVKGIRQFLGLCGYYRRFIKDFAKIAKPLTRLLQKEVAFEWDDSTEQAFQTLKNALCEAPVLAFPDLSQPYNITTDASGYAIGGVLSQGPIGKDRPIAYTSRMLRGPKLNYEIYEKEAVSILHSVKKFRSYVHGRKITIITDHQALVWFKSADLNTRVQKWRFKLSEYEYDIIYKPGKLNSNADALSRNPPGKVNVFMMTRAEKKKSFATPKITELPMPIPEPIPEFFDSVAQKRKRGRPPKNRVIVPVIETEPEENNQLDPAEDVIVEPPEIAMSEGSDASVSECENQPPEQKGQGRPPKPLPRKRTKPVESERE